MTRMRHSFNSQLDELNNHVIMMGSIIELSMDEMIIALEHMDTELAKIIIDRDDEIDALEQQIERESIMIITKQQPIATDLRKITSIMKIVTDIERIADQCADISEYILKLNKLPSIRAPKELSHMIAAMKKMVIDTIDSFVAYDLNKANLVIKADDEVDESFEIVMKELENMMQGDLNIVPQCVCYLMIVKYIERMADHATNIAEWITFIITGELY